MALKLVGSLCDGGEVVQLSPSRVTPRIPQLQFGGRPFRKSTNHKFFPGTNIVTVDVHGGITADDMLEMRQVMDEVIREHGKIRMVAIRGDIDHLTAVFSHVGSNRHKIAFVIRGANHAPSPQLTPHSWAR